MSIKRKNKLLIAVIITAVIFAAVAAWLIYMFYIPPCGCSYREPYDGITMPAFIGMSFDEVVEQYPDLFLNPIEEYSAEHEKGIIMRQSVLPGRPIRETHKIDIWVSLGAEPYENDADE
jgi:hypothetical protein